MFYLAPQEITWLQIQCTVGMFHFYTFKTNAMHRVHFQMCVSADLRLVPELRNWPKWPSSQCPEEVISEQALNFTILHLQLQTLNFTVGWGLNMTTVKWSKGARSKVWLEQHSPCNIFLCFVHCSYENRNMHVPAIIEFHLKSNHIQDVNLRGINMIILISNVPWWTSIMLIMNEYLVTGLMAVVKFFFRNS